MAPKQFWRVEFFEEEDGSQPVMDYINSGHSDKDIAVIINVLSSLQARGPDIQGTNMDDRIKGPIRELRKDRHRILYAQVGNTFVLLTAFIKKTQKTPIEQIDLAEKSLKKYQQKHNVR
jgi:phage-related protein